MKEYYIPTGPGEAELVEKRSRFIGQVWRVSSEEEARARIEEVRYGVKDPKAGCCGSVLNLFEERFNHHPRIYQGPLTAECEMVLQEFFQGLR